MSERAKKTAQAIRYATAQPYELGKNDCVTFAREVYAAVSDRKTVRVPKYWYAGEDHEALFTRLIREHGSMRRPICT